MKTEIIKKKISDKHEQSYWYDGQIATKGKYHLYACGEVRLNCDCKPQDDKDLEKCYENDHFSLNNWFEVIGDEPDDYMLGDVVGTYDEGLELLDYYVEEDIYEYNS